MTRGIRAVFQELRSLPFGSITDAYTPIGNAFPSAIRIISLNNSTNEDALISFDATTDHLLIPAGTFSLYDLCSNKVTDDGLFISLGTVVYGKRQGNTSPTSGSLWIEAVSSNDR